MQWILSAHAGSKRLRAGDTIDLGQDKFVVLQPLSFNQQDPTTGVAAVGAGADGPWHPMPSTLQPCTGVQAYACLLANYTGFAAKLPTTRLLRAPDRKRSGPSTGRIQGIHGPLRQLCAYFNDTSAFKMNVASGGHSSECPIAITLPAGSVAQTAARLLGVAGFPGFIGEDPAYKV
jgi:hypothetical protein